jgi:hypothetical protein
VSRSVTITVVTANIGRGVSTDVAHANIRRVARSFPGAFVGFQEIDEADSPDEAALIEARFPSGDDGSPLRMHDALASSGQGTYAFAGFSGPGWKRATPFGVPTTWDVLRQSARKSSDGLAHVTPHRVIVSAQCRPADDPDFPPVMFLNGHYPLARTEAAKQLWRDCQASWTARANKVHDAAEGGFTIITTRDTNRHGPMPKVHPRERQLLAPGIDRISVIPAESSSPHLVTVRVLDRRVVNLTIDGHDAHAVVLRLTAPNA